jgi:hypothetical protein
MGWCRCVIKFRHCCREVADYLRSKNSRSTSAAQVEARRHFAKLEKDGDDVKGMLDEVMMYTYVDKDNFKQDKVSA